MYKDARFSYDNVKVMQSAIDRANFGPRFFNAVQDKDEAVIMWSLIDGFNNALSQLAPMPDIRMLCHDWMEIETTVVKVVASIARQFVQDHSDLGPAGIIAELRNRLSYLGTDGLYHEE